MTSNMRTAVCFHCVKIQIVLFGVTLTVDDILFLSEVHWAGSQYFFFV